MLFIISAWLHLLNQNNTGGTVARHLPEVFLLAADFGHCHPGLEGHRHLMSELPTDSPNTITVHILLAYVNIRYFFFLTMEGMYFVSIGKKKIKK